MAHRVRTQPALPTADPGSLTLDTALQTVLTDWASSAEHSEQTLARMTETVLRFTDRLHAQGVTSFAAVTPAAAVGFVAATTGRGTPPEQATMHARRTALRTLYRTLRRLGLHDSDPTLDLRLPPRGLTAARPLTDDEIVLCRASAQLGAGSSLRAIAWALGEATAVSSEITQIRIADLDNPVDPRRVQLPGTRRHDPRTATLNRWAQMIVRRRSAELRAVGAGPHVLLAYAGSAPPGGAKAQASVCNALRHVLDAAGLIDEPDVRPVSVRNWAGRSLLDAGVPIEQIAQLLGCRSLDAAAEAVALDWRAVPA